MKRIIKIVDGTRAENAVNALMELPHDGTHEVEIRPIKKDRSVAQNSLMWLWNSVISAETGETKDEVHWRNKKTFLSKILIRDDREYAEALCTLRSIHRQGLSSSSEQLFNYIVDKVSTRHINTDQFSELLNDIEQYHISVGIILPHPDDYRLAMGAQYAG